VNRRQIPTTRFGADNAADEVKVMKAAQRNPWIIAAVLFTTMFLIWGAD